MRRAILAVTVTILLTAIGQAADKIDVAQLARDLSSRDAKVAVAAADRLAAAGADAKSAVGPLSTALASSDADLRWHAARALAGIGPDAAASVPALIKTTQDKEALVRAQSARALGLIGNQEQSTIAALAARIVDPDAQVRRAAVGAISRLSPDSKATLPVIVQTLDDADPSVIMPALETLAEGGAQAVPALREALQHKRGRYWAELVLAEMGPAAKDATGDLTKLLADDEPEVRLQAALALGAIGRDAASAAPALSTALGDKIAGIRYAAAFALGQIGATSALPGLENAEEDRDPFLQMVAAWAVAKLKPDDKQAVDKALGLIVAALRQDNPNVRRGAARALLELNAPQEVVGPALIAALDDPDPAVQENVYSGLASMGAAAVPKVIEHLKEEKSRARALRILRLMGPQAKGAVADLAAGLGNTDALTRREILFVLAGIGPDSAPATPAILKSLADDDPDVRIAACYALGKIGPAAKSAVEELRKNLAGKDRIVRLVSVWALLRIQPDDAKTVQMAVPVLTTVVSEGESELARFEAAAALGDIGAAAQSAVPALQKALDDESPVVRDAAAAALKKLGK